MIQAVIFDMDGVIVDSIPLHFKAWKQCMKELGVDLTFEEFNKRNGCPASETFAIWQKQFNLDLNIKEVTERKRELSDEYLDAEIKLFPGVIETLESLKDYYLGLATSAYPSTVDLVFNKFPISYIFNAVTTAADVTHGKPDPEPYLKTAKKLNIKPENCVVVEDAVNGIKSAKSAGMKVIGITTSFPKESLSEADIIINNFNEITPELIKSLS